MKTTNDDALELAAFLSVTNMFPPPAVCQLESPRESEDLARHVCACVDVCAPWVHMCVHVCVVGVCIVFVYMCLCVCLYLCVGGVCYVFVCVVCGVCRWCGVCV